MMGIPVGRKIIGEHLVIENTSSVYQLKLTLHGGSNRELYYAGETTGKPKIRLQKHISSINRVSFTGCFIKIFDEAYLQGVTAITVEMAVLQTNLTVKEAKRLEANLALALRNQYGAENVLSNPKKLPSP